MRQRGNLEHNLGMQVQGGRSRILTTKVSSYIPVVSKMQQQAFDQGEAEKERKDGGPPNGPDHDVQVQQFLRKRYHGKSRDGIPNPDSRD